MLITKYYKVELKTENERRRNMQKNIIKIGIKVVCVRVWARLLYFRTGSINYETFFIN